MPLLPVGTRVRVTDWHYAPFRDLTGTVTEHVRWHADVVNHYRVTLDDTPRARMVTAYRNDAAQFVPTNLEGHLFSIWAVEPLDNGA